MVFHLFHQTKDFFSVDFFVCGAGEGGWLFFLFSLGAGEYVCFRQEI